MSGVDETAVRGVDPADTALLLARAKARAVAARLPGAPAIVVGCDSVLELGDGAYGKPADAADALSRWRRMRGQTGTLHTGHCVVETGTGREVSAVSSTLVRFAHVTDPELEAYVASGEPLQVAGAFTVDGLGGAFVEGIEGDHHGVVGISLPLLRVLLLDLGVRWTDLWAPSGT